MGQNFRVSGLPLFESFLSALTVVVATTSHLWRHARTAGHLRPVHRGPEQRVSGRLATAQFLYPRLGLLLLQSAPHLANMFAVAVVVAGVALALSVSLSLSLVTKFRSG